MQQVAEEEPLAVKFGLLERTGGDRALIALQVINLVRKISETIWIDVFSVHGNPQVCSAVVPTVAAGRSEQCASL
jgi:hypothetical protein